MTNRSHQKAFSLLLLSKDRQLSPSERSFLDGHLKTCDSCRERSEIHQALQKSLRSTSPGPVIPKQQFQTKLPELLRMVERRRTVQKTTNIILTSIKLGVAVVLIASLLWVLNQNLPRLAPAVSTRETPVLTTPVRTPSLVAPSAIPVLKVTPAGAVSKPRTEVITYTVQQNDTIFGIAEKFQLKPETILWGNYATLADDPSILRPGMKINILPVDGAYYEWKEGDDLNAVASRLGVRPEDITDWPGNRLKSETQGDLSRPNIEPGTMLVIPGGRREFLPWSTPPYPG